MIDHREVPMHKELEVYLHDARMGKSRVFKFESPIAACMHAKRIKIIEKPIRARLELSGQNGTGA